VPKKSVFTRVFSLLENQKARTACTLPNVARYQLRHTPMDFNIIIINEFLGFVNVLRP